MSHLHICSAQMSCLISICHDDQHFLMMHTLLLLCFQRKSFHLTTSHGWILPCESQNLCSLMSCAPILTRSAWTINCQRQFTVFMEPWFSVDTLSVQMPLLSSQFLQKHRELRLAHLVLSMMTMGYTWQEGENNTVEVSLSFSFNLCYTDFSLMSVSLQSTQFIWRAFHLQ